MHLNEIRGRVPAEDCEEGDQKVVQVEVEAVSPAGGVSWRGGSTRRIRPIDGCWEAAEGEQDGQLERVCDIGENAELEAQKKTALQRHNKLQLRATKFRIESSCQTADDESWSSDAAICALDGLARSGIKGRQGPVPE